MRQCLTPHSETPGQVCSPATHLLLFIPSRWNVMQKRLAVLLMLLAMPLAAQIQGTISGYIRDSSGAVIPKAAVRIINEKTGATRNGLSDDAGFYQVLGLISGTYT